MIDGYLGSLAGKGRSSSSLESYRRVLKGIYEYLPEGKEIREGTGAEWKSYLEGQGFSPVTVDCRISVWNGLVQYLGHREWQMDDFRREKGEVQPELSRAEYLKLLSMAKHMGKEKAYLLIKTLGGAGMRVQELPQLTVEAVGRGGGRTGIPQRPPEEGIVPAGRAAQGTAELYQPGRPPWGSSVPLPGGRGDGPFQHQLPGRYSRPGSPCGRGEGNAPGAVENVPEYMHGDRGGCIGANRAGLPEGDGGGTVGGRLGCLRECLGISTSRLL